MRSGSRLAWLGLTPEPERELPVAVALLRARQRVVEQRTSRHDPAQQAESRQRRDPTPAHLAQDEVGLDHSASAPEPRLAPAFDPRLAPWVDAERKRITEVVLHGTQRSWLRYLQEVTALVTTAASTDPASAATTTTSAREHDLDLVLHAAETVLDHHQMLIGLPGQAYEQVAADREALTAVVADLRARLASR